jgi:excinuclease ABC subunit C
LLQQARDEAHRFAITFNRVRRKARTVTSMLLELPGVGPKRRRALLSAFGSLEGVRSASPEAIAAVPGFSVASANRLLEALREPPSNTDAPVAPAAPVAPVAPAAPNDTPIPES